MPLFVPRVNLFLPFGSRRPPSTNARPPSSIGILGQLPPEIIEEIVEALDRLSLLTFSLTCTTFYYDYFSEAPSLLHFSDEERKAFLLLLERDTTRLYSCENCRTLHPWSGNRLSASCIRRGGKDCGQYFTFDHARLVMNRHLRGPAHGLPVESIESDCCKVSSWGLGVVLKESWRARTIEVNLLLCPMATRH